MTLPRGGPALAFALLAVTLTASLAAPAPARANGIVFGEPSAEARVGAGIFFETRFTADRLPTRVEVLISVPGDERSVTVLPAQIGGGRDGDWLATAALLGHSPPNTIYDYRFRGHSVDGAVSLGPAARITVVDDRYDWRLLEGDAVRLHWHEGDEAFARRALGIGDAAVTRAAELLGVTEFEAVDFFIYATSDGLRGALGPGAREWAAGQARADIRTMFGLIEPFEINSGWVESLVSHELTHLVFHAATENPYHSPPSWLDEGLAVYLADGYGAGDRGVVQGAARRGELMPLEALGGAFPTQRDRALLAYAESVSAVDFLVNRYGEEQLGILVSSYAEGVTDDEAFLAATGADMAAFDAAWMAEQGIAPPQPFGPQPGPTGPLPGDWTVGGQTPAPASPSPAAPGQTPGQSAPPGTTAQPGSPGPGNSPAPGGVAGNGPDSALILFLGGGALLALLLVGLLLFAQRATRPPAPPPPPPAAPWS